MALRPLRQGGQTPQLISPRGSGMVGAMDSTVLLGFAILVAAFALAGLAFALLRSTGARAEMLARLQVLNETQTATSSQISRTLEERLDQIGKRLGDGLMQHSEKTGESLNQLKERLAVIDSAQKNLTDLGQQMVGLQDILSNKQARGAFGEIQLQDLVTNILPPSVYRFQATLSNGKRADCLLDLPNPPGAIVIDAKFPLESYHALREAGDDEARTRAGRAFSADIQKHVRDIAEKYIVPGETAESALMFLPSEAVYAELHANFRGAVEDSFRRKVWIVSPTTLMATLNTVRAVLKDARMQEQAGLIQTEVMKLLDDVGRLDKRVESLQSHFRLAAKDIDDIGVSSKKVKSRGTHIEDMQMDDPNAETLIPDPPAAKITRIP